MGMSDPLITFAGIPLCAGVAVFALGHLFASEVLRSWLSRHEARRWQKNTAARARRGAPRRGVCP